MAVEKHKIAYLAPIYGLSLEQQEAMAKAARCGVIYRRDEAPKQDVRSRWIMRCADGDIAWVPDLRVLIAAKPDRGTTKPTTDFAATLQRLAARGCVIVDGRTGTTSKDGNAWIELVKWTMDRVSATHRKRSAVAKSLAKARRSKPHGVVTAWRSDAMKEQRERWAPVWFDVRHPSRAAARDALPEPLCRMSVVSVWRIFKDLDPRKRKKSKR